MDTILDGEVRDLKRSQKITRFLLDMNKLLDGIHIQEITEYGLERIHIKFEAGLSSIFVQPGMWSPSTAFYIVLEQCANKHFKAQAAHKFNFNNTHTIFWIEEYLI